MEILPQSSNRRLALGAIASWAVNIIKVGLQLILLPVMARLLGPEEFGIYALALPTVAFAALLADGGLGSTLAREPESSSVVWSSAFWILLFSGIALALITSLFGIFLGYIVQQPRVPAMIGFLSISFVFLTLSVVPGARLSRRKDLGTGAVAELLANLTGAAVAVILAVNGAGAWSLVFQYVSVYVVRSLVLNFAAYSAPGLEFSMRAVQPHVISGGVLIGTRLCDYAGRVTENILIGRIFGTTLLGSYSFANQVSRFAGEAVGNVTWATLYVQAITSDNESAVKLHRQLCRLLAAVLFPSMLLAAVAAPELIDLLLGPKWVELAFFLRVLLPVSALTIVATQVGALLLANGRFHIQFWCTAGQSVGRAIAICLGPWIGLTGTIYGIALVALLYCAALLFFARESTRYQPVPMLMGLVGPAISSIVAAGLCFVALQALPESATGTLIGLFIGLVAFAACMLLIDRKGLIEDWESARNVMSKRQRTQLAQGAPGPDIQ